MLDTVQLSRPLGLFEGYSPTEIRRKDIVSLRDARITGWDAKPLPLPLLGPEDRKCEVHTINELERRKRQGYFAATTADMRIQANYFELAKTVLIAAQLASKAEVSFIDEPFLSVSSIEFMPAHALNLLNEMSDGDFKSVDDDRTVAQLLAAGECTISQNDPTAITIEKFQRVFSMEILRADLNGDGIKDILVHQAFQVIGGSMSWSSSSILTRLSPEGLFERVPLSLG